MSETLTFNSDWSVAARSQSVDADDALTDTSGLPDALVAQSGDTYAVLRTLLGVLRRLITMRMEQFLVIQM